MAMKGEFLFMAVNEQIVTGRKFRKLVDEATKLWQRISFWTKASDVEFNDGSTAETKMGAINGITDSLASTSSNVAASAKALNQLNNKLTVQLQGDVRIFSEGSGENVKYYAQTGADTASKKILGSGGNRDFAVFITENTSSASASLTVLNSENSNNAMYYGYGASNFQINPLDFDMYSFDYNNTNRHNYTITFKKKCKAIMYERTGSPTESIYLPGDTYAWSYSKGVHLVIVPI